MATENEKLIVGALDRIAGVLDDVTTRLDRLESDRLTSQQPLPVEVVSAGDRTPPPPPDVEWTPDDAEPVLPDPPKELSDEWAAMADQLFENWKPQVEKGLTLDAPRMAEAYIKGGPLWLAAYAHEFLMGLPYNWRQIMVQQVNRYAPVAGGQLGRDILRADAASANAWAYQRGEEQADLRHKGIVEKPGPG